MIEKAYGKINISLDVVGKSDNGYHEMDMIMVPIGLYDVLDIEIAKENSYSCNIDLPFDSNNIIYKTIKLLRKYFNLNESFAIKLEKNIPMQAGLAGGSSDGAATLRIINELCDLFLPDEILISLAKEIGADVPFCLFQKPARVQGIGEKLEFFELEKQWDVVLIKPEKGVNTKEAFTLLDKMEYDHPNIDKILHQLIHDEELQLGNSLEASAFKLVPEISDIKDKCLEMGYRNTLMTGSGSTVFVMVEKGVDTTILEEMMQESGYFVWKTHINKVS